MAVTLEIRDGDPWYLSPDVWTVPGDDPEGSPGLPIVGSPCYLWARVRNNGSDAVTNATVRFYWANPSVGFDRTTATFVGSAFVSLGGGDIQEVLCLTPWVPVFVNNGHECVLAETLHPTDPLPPGQDFNAPSDRHVAQRNLDVVMALRGSFHMAFEVHNPTRQERIFNIRAEVGRIEQVRPLVAHLGKSFDLPDDDGEVQDLGFVPSPCPNQGEREKPHKYIERLALGPFGRTGFSLVGKLQGQAAVVHVIQRLGDRDVGGLAVLVLKGGK